MTFGENLDWQSGRLVLSRIISGGGPFSLDSHSKRSDLYTFLRNTRSCRVLDRAKIAPYRESRHAWDLITSSLTPRDLVLG
mgnify:CR=1 FL=1